MKNKYLILLAGPPSTGKTYLTKKIKGVMPHMEVITPDEIKEILSDNEGFNDLLEKEQLEKKVWQIYYYILDYLMGEDIEVILTEYPFSDKQRPFLEGLAVKHSYTPVTVRLNADFDILWGRRKMRDRSSDRHLSHIMKSYHKGDILLDRSQADNLITKSEFYKIINDRKYNEFELGKLFTFDVTDYNKTNYTSFFNYLKTI